MMIDEQNKQWSTRENNKAKQITRVEAKEFMPNRLDDGKQHDERTLKTIKMMQMTKTIKTLLKRRKTVGSRQKTHANR